MYVCLCGDVTDKQIRDAISDGACSMKDLNAIGVGNCCGQCAPCAQEILQEASPAN